MPASKGPSEWQRAWLFRDGHNQALRIPKTFELPGDEVMVHRDGDRLIIEPIAKMRGLLEVLAELEPLDDTLPDIDAGPLRLDENGFNRD